MLKIGPQKSERLEPPPLRIIDLSPQGDSARGNSSKNLFPVPCSFLGREPQKLIPQSLHAITKVSFTQPGLSRHFSDLKQARILELADLFGSQVLASENT